MGLRAGKSAHRVIVPLDGVVKIQCLDFPHLDSRIRGAREKILTATKINVREHH